MRRPEIFPTDTPKLRRLKRTQIHCPARQRWRLPSLPMQFSRRAQFPRA